MPNNRDIRRRGTSSVDVWGPYDAVVNTGSGIAAQIQANEEAEREAARQYQRQREQERQWRISQEQYQEWRENVMPNNLVANTDMWKYTITSDAATTAYTGFKSPKQDNVVNAARNMRDGIKAIFGDTAMLQSKNGFKLREMFDALDKAVDALDEKAK